VNVAVPIGLAVPEQLAHPRPGQSPPAAVFAQLDAAPIDSLWVLDQLSGRHPSSEAASLLSFVAALTSRVRLGVAVYVGPARGPLAAAKALATVDQLSGGRLTVGLGMGNLGHYGAYGWAGHRPGSVFDEFVESLVALWGGAAGEAPGRVWDVSGFAISPGPLQQPHPPLWFGGGTERSFRRAARWGSGWIGAGKQTLNEFEKCASEVRELVGAEDRADFTVSKRIYLLVDARRARAQERTRRWFETFYRRPELGQEVTVMGDVSACVEQIAAHFQAGANHVVLHPLDDGEDQYRTVIDEVVPASAAALRLPIAEI
jgi:alkanesulfonate monooxygenase SsuD/methylene tetrahydromethanopterin reductase-like flavin-dependent oxidoreductase (luciferase family)